MRAMCLVLALCVVITTGVSNSAVAGEALQWRIEGGGNGHWYQRFDAAVEVNWIESRNAAVSGGGYLVTLTSSAEQTWVTAHFVTGLPTCSPASWATPRSAWIGLFQDRQSPSYSEPAGGWRWVTDEPFQFRAPATRDGRADNQIALARPAGQQDVERSEEQHEQRDALRYRQGFQLCREFRRQAVAEAMTAIALQPRPGPVDGQVEEHRRILQVLPPVGSLPLQFGAGQPVPLPDCEIGVLDGQRGQQRWPAPGKRRVGGGQIPEQHAG